MNPHFGRATARAIAGFIIYHLSTRYLYNNYSQKRSKMVKSIKGRDPVERYWHLQPFWGNIVIFNRDERTEDMFAFLLDVDGTRCHGLTKAMFDHMRRMPGCEHVYVDRAQGREVDRALEIIKKMGPEQLDHVYEAIRARRNNLEADELD